MMKKLFLLILTLMLMTPYLSAKIVEEKITYRHNQEKLTGYLYYDTQIKGKKPLVLVVHEWWGLNDYAKGRAKQLAELGYVGFAIDMYGSSKQTRHAKQAKLWRQAISKNKENWQQRAITALEIGKKHPQVAKNKTAAIGYCFGGATVLQMAYAAADLDAVISFHGGLAVPNAQQIKQLKTPILINNGADDNFISQKSINQWQSAMQKTNSRWLFVNFSGAKHAFTNNAADEYGKINGIANLGYQQYADYKSWQLSQDFLADAFK